MFTRQILTAAALACAGITAAHAAPLAANGQWVPFDVDAPSYGTLGWIDVVNYGAPLSFSFTVASGFVGTLTVVDAGFSGDTFIVSSGNATLGTTSAAVNSYPTSIGLDFDAALLNPNYSRGVFVLAAGSYDVTGVLSTSALDGTGAAIDATVGGIRLTVSAVPEPATLATMLAGLGLLAFAVRRSSK